LGRAINDPDANPQLVCDGSPRHSLASQAANRCCVHDCPRPTEHHAFRARVSESRANAVSDKLPFEFGDAGKNPEDEPSVWRGSVHTLMQGDKLNSKGAELLKRIHQLAQTSSESVIAVNREDVKPSTTSIGQQTIQRWTRILCAGYSLIHELAYDLPTAAVAVFSDLVNLKVWILPMVEC
jgi:hypothetical protein